MTAIQLNSCPTGHRQTWDGKRYHSLNWELKKQYHKRLYKIALNGGMTCPNRDGTLGSRGCIFCSEGGSGDFAGDVTQSVTRQLQAGKEHLAAKYDGHSYIAYFQAYTNTYAPVSYLEKLFMEAIQDPDVEILSIATRPDCLPDEVICLLSGLNRIKPVWIELGLQTVHEDTAQLIRRGYPLSVFEDALKRLREKGLTVIVHTILFLPGETREKMLETISWLNRQDIQGIKLQLLHILKGTDLSVYYQTHPFHVPDLEEYLSLLGDCIALLRPDIVIHRVTGDGPKELLIAPLFTGHKKHVLNSLGRRLREQDIWQGKEYRP